jgi:hypothetical protein
MTNVEHGTMGREFIMSISGGVPETEAFERLLASGALKTSVTDGDTTRVVDSAGFARLVQMGLDVEQWWEAVNFGMDDIERGNDLSWGRDCDQAAVDAFNQRISSFNMSTAISQAMDRRG